MFYYEGCVTELKIPTQTALKLVEMQSLYVTIKITKPSLSATVSPWSIGICAKIDCRCFMCACASYYMCVFICSAQCIKIHQQQIQAHQKDTQRLCMRNVSRVYGGGIKHMCSEDPLSTTSQYTSHGCRILVQFIEINTIGGNQCVAAVLPAAVVALACSKAVFNVGRISLCVTCDGLMSWLQMLPNQTRK